MEKAMTVAKLLARRSTKQEVISLEECLASWATEPLFSRSAAGRIHHAFGTPTVIDTAKDERLGRIFSGRTIRTYSCFAALKGIEEPLQNVVDFFAHSAGGLEQARQILYLKGPVGSGKSTIVEIIKRLAEQEPMFVLAVKSGDGTVEISPVFENPLGLFSAPDCVATMESEYKIPAFLLRAPLSPSDASDCARHLGHTDHAGCNRAMAYGYRRSEVRWCRQRGGGARPDGRDLSASRGACLLPRDHVRVAGSVADRMQQPREPALLRESVFEWHRPCSLTTCGSHVAGRLVPVDDGSRHASVVRRLVLLRARRPLLPFVRDRPMQYSAETRSYARRLRTEMEGHGVAGKTVTVFFVLLFLGLIAADVSTGKLDDKVGALKEKIFGSKTK
ncbi:hypothetical protein EBR66_05160 [bacterium]|nr:hypothetical protein [bacterium]